MDFYSHPGKLLVDHLKNVYTISSGYADEKYHNLLETICISHDFGKYTTYFQNYLFNKRHVKNDYSNHGFISALFAANAAFKQFGEKNFLPLLSYSIVLHHHGSLQNVSDDLPRRFKFIDRDSDNINLINKIDVAHVQIEDIGKNYDTVLHDYELLGYGDYFKDFFSCNIEELLKKLKRMQLRFNEQDGGEEFYFMHQALYSALIAADKIDASNTMLPHEKYTNFSSMMAAKDNKFKGSKNNLNDIRNSIFNDVQKSIVEYAGKRMFSITSPTGTGKTYTGFFAALKLSQMLGGNKKIIYCLPFTSIIDQNFSSLRELLQTIDSFNKQESQYIIKHHNLSNIDYKSLDTEYKNTQAEILIENWDSGIIVTTFVQLLETLIGSRNRMLKKFHAFRNSIILLDEVQSIDIEYLKLVDNVLLNAVKYLNCRIILMTATKPLILPQATELIPDCKYYFSKLSRTKLMPVLKKMDTETFMEKFYDKIKDKSCLIICNTIGESLDIYNKFKTTGREIYYLSTNLLPIHRSKRIEHIKERLSSKAKIVLVSTQVVEAGVDIDFDMVIRDIAPLDSIIQSAGRCNRNGRLQEKGIVYIVTLIDNKGSYYANHVYGTTLVNLTMSLLSTKSQIIEEEYYDLINRYYIEVNNLKNQDLSLKLIDSMKNLRFSTDSDSNFIGLDKFSLIKNNPDYVDVFFRIDDTAENIYQQFLNMLSEKNHQRQREMYLQIKNKFREYTISIPQKYYKKFEFNKFNNTGILNLPYEGCRDYYNEETGFKREASEDFMFF
jgi:CRISPR-associated endonuclease/helicase Cas3